jgi:hypothetical protein
MKKDLIDTLTSHKPFLDRSQTRDKFSQNGKDSERALLDKIVQQMQAMSAKSTALATEHHILDSLYFPQMPMRQEAIRQTYSDTFSWIFDEDSTDFRSWLQQDSGIFWVRGKAGSGKSTLMKFLSGHAQTPDILQHWAGPKRLVAASYYFWSAGTPMQKSQKGLLQSLLFQLLSQCPELIPVASPHRWNAPAPFHCHPEPWHSDELSKALSAVLSKEQLPARFCFFIDGLDEYSGDHYDLAREEEDRRGEVDHYELIRLFEDLARNPDVKLCLSSRPWNAFRKAFGRGKRKTLVLEELTREDIVKYIRGMLESDPRFEELATKDEHAGEVVSQIQERAEGVFLWVYLAVRSALRGLSEDDDIQELQRRIQNLPLNLKEFFRRILSSIDTEYRELTCRLLALASYEPHLPLRTCWHLKLELDDPDYALKAEPEHCFLHYPTLKSSATTYINKWCRDLLQIQKECDETVIVFLHRTVKDFLTDSDVRKHIEDFAGKDFNEPLSMCRLHLARAKSLAHTPSPRKKKKRDRFWWLTRDIMRHAKVYEAKNAASLTVILNEFDRLGHQCIGQHWVDDITWDHRQLNQPSTFRAPSKSDLLSLAVCYNLLQFVSETLQNHPEAIHKAGRPLLDYAIDSRYNAWTYFWVVRQETSTEMIQILLNAGADVNSNANILGNASIWQLFLHWIYRHGTVEGPLQRETAVIFLDHGADIDCKVLIKVPTPTRVPVYATVSKCLNRIFSTEEVTKLLADARSNRIVPPQDPVPPPQTWTSWLMPWR